MREALPLLIRLNCLLVVALVSAITGNEIVLLCVVVLHIAWPISALIPRSWRAEITQEAAVRAITWFIPGIVLAYVGAFGASRDGALPATALVIGAGAIHHLVVLAALGRCRGLPLVPMVVGASMGGIAGALASLPTALGWDTLALMLYGFFGIGAVSAALLDARDQR